MGLPTKKGKSGAARAFISRKKAMQKLNLSLKEFRRLCILKGVYPVEPRKKNKLNPGNKMKTYYLLTDIQYLSHEPIIWKFWEFKIFMRRMKRAKAFKDGPRIESMLENKPFYKLDHIVRERYPTFMDALRDLDDGLSMCFLYRRFSKSLSFPQDLIEMSRKLTVEFMHWIIDARALRKVFVSIKGYYFQAEIMGQQITWISPHPFVVPKMADIDAKVIRSFTEFYIHLLGFVNFRLYKQNSILYPPRVSSDQVNASAAESFDEETLKKELLYGLNRPLVKEVREEAPKADTFEEPEESEETEAKSAFGLTYRQTIKLQSLFDGCRFFLNREVPQEPLTFMIRSFGGSVSWYSTQHPGATYEESDDKITHHVVDKEVPNKRLDRVYIQPQWIFDSINARQLLNCQDYFPGVTLPPHLSPFVEDESSELHYVTPDAARLKGEAVKPIQVTDDDGDENVSKTNETGKKRKTKSPAHGSNEKKARGVTQSKVVSGQAIKLDKDKEKAQVESEEKKLAVMMIPKKQKKLYDKVVKLKKDKLKKVAKLTSKRVRWEDEQKKKKSHSG